MKLVRVEHTISLTPDTIQALKDIFNTDLSSFTSKLDTIMSTLADIQAKNQQLLDAVAAEDTVIDSAVTLIGGFATTLQSLKDQLAAAIAAGADPAVLDALSQSFDGTITDINAKKDALAAAVTANTPAS